MEILPHVNGGNILLSSPGMDDMAENIFWILQRQATTNGWAPFERCTMSLARFPNGEHEPELTETVRGAHVFLLHPMQLPDPNAAVVNLLLMLDALTSAAVGKITLVLPYMSFMRQDRRKDNKRVPISARAIIKAIEYYKPTVAQVITLDLHADQEAGFFTIPVDNIPGAGVCIEDLRERLGDELQNIVVVSPDIGSVTRVRRIARKLHAPLAIIDKDRKGPGNSEVIGIMGESVQGRHAVLFDDMIDTGGTIINAAKKVLEEGAASIEIYAIHGLFCGAALEQFRAAQIPVRVTNSIPRSMEFKFEHNSWLSFVSIAPLLAEAIYQTCVVRGSFAQFSRIA